VISTALNSLGRYVGRNLTVIYSNSGEQSIGDGVLELTHTRYWTPSPSPSLVAAQYAVSEVMRLLAASASRCLSCDTSPPQLPYAFVMFLM
jgi:hypothetical protein